MSRGDYVAGVFFFAATGFAALATAAIVVRRGLPHLAGAPAAVAFAVVGTCVVVAAHVVPGALTVLSRGTVPVAAVAIAAGAWLATRGARGDRPSPAVPAPRLARAGAASWILAALAVAAVALWYVTLAWTQTAIPATGTDTLAFHLPEVARWIQTGDLWRVSEFQPYLAAGDYPQNGDILVLAWVLPWHNDAFARLAGYPYLAVTGLAVFAIAGELRAPRPAAAIAAVTVLALPLMARTLGSGTLTDPMAYAAVAAGVLFLLRYTRTRRRGELVVAGLALGLAFGTKWYAAGDVIVVVAVWCAALLIARRPPREVVRDTALVALLVACAGGFWLVRNWVVTGDPFFPIPVRVAGVTIFAAPRDIVLDRTGFSVLDYFGDWAIWRHWLVPAWRLALSWPGAAVLIGSALAAFVAAWRGRSGGRYSVLPVVALLACALLLVVVYAATPQTAEGPRGLPVIAYGNSRYLLPALVVAAPLVGWVLPRLGRARVIAELVIVATVAQGIRRGFDLPRADVARVGLVLLGLGAIAAAGWRVGRASTRRAKPRAAARGRPTIAVAAALAAAIALVAVGDARQRRFNDGRYAHTGEPALDWIAANAPSGHRIALQGPWSPARLAPILPAFGPRLRNTVGYVGPVVDGQKRDWPTQASFAAALRRDRFDLLLVSRAGPEPSRGDGWARALRFPVVVSGPYATLYRVRS